MKKQSIEEAYCELLTRYVDHPHEEALASVADLGRELVLADVPPEDIGEMHAEAVRRMAQEFPDTALPGTVYLAPIPLIEVLMAYGLAFRAQSAAHRRAKEELKEYSQRLESTVTELSEAQEQLVRREKLAVLGQMAGSVSHELRNPLGAITNAVYYLNMVHTDADESTRECLDIISIEVGRSNKIITDLLDLTRIQSAERKEVTVSALVAQALLSQPPPGEINVRDSVASDLPPVCVDPEQIGGQVLVNLLANAYQAMPEGGELIISAQAEQDQAVISIADSGCGIPPENAEKIFEPLFTTKARGIGLGLAISRNLVQANGGSMCATSAGVPGQGSTFTIRLPLAQPMVETIG